MFCQCCINQVIIINNFLLINENLIVQIFFDIDEHKTQKMAFKTEAVLLHLPMIVFVYSSHVGTVVFGKVGETAGEG